MKSFFICLTALLTALLAAAPAGAQVPTANTKRFEQPTTSAGGGTANPGVIMLSNEDYRLAPKDVIEVHVEDAPELSGANFQIGAAGTIPMHYLGVVKVSGMTAEEVARLISDKLRGRYLKDPKVSVLVKAYNSRAFFIQGSVRSPGVYFIEGRPTLFRLITIAGGLQENHGATAFVIREKKGAVAAPVPPAAAGQANVGDGEENVELITAQISGLFKGRFDQNLMIEPGDVVTIPQIDVFYVAGEVNAPGAFPLKEGTTLRQAISLAQGTLFKAATNRAVIFRDDANTGTRKEISIDVGAVMSGKSKEDIPIMPNDIIMVPGSRMKSVGQTLLQALGSSARLPYPR